MNCELSSVARKNVEFESRGNADTINLSVCVTNSKVGMVSIGNNSLQPKDAVGFLLELSNALFSMSQEVEDIQKFHREAAKAIKERKGYTVNGRI